MQSETHSATAAPNHVTTGPIRGSRKLYVSPSAYPEIRVPFRQVELSSGRESSLNLYDASGPYTETEAPIDLARGLPAIREAWLAARDLESIEGRAIRPEDNGTPLHRKIMQEQKEKELQHKIRRLAKETGLFFLFKQSCPHCHAFAPVVKEFAQQYGFEVKAISGDGGKLKEFPEAVPDNGIIQKVNVKGVYPALFLAHPPTGNVIPVAWGMTTPTQLMDNFTTIIKALERQDFNES